MNLSTTHLTATLGNNRHTRMVLFLIQTYTNTDCASYHIYCTFTSLQDATVLCVNRVGLFHKNNITCSARSLLCPLRGNRHLEMCRFTYTNRHSFVFCLFLPVKLGLNVSNNKNNLWSELCKQPELYPNVKWSSFLVEQWLTSVCVCVRSCQLPLMQLFGLLLERAG